MERAGESMVVVMEGGLMLLMMAISSSATVYTVGDTSGWTIGVDYTTWATAKSFTIGDTLGGLHTVDEVRPTDYSTCTIGNSISSDSSGSTTVILRAAGTHYYMCAIMGHCSSGMKLSITVTTTSSGTGATTSPPCTCADAGNNNSGLPKSTYNYYPYDWSLGLATTSHHYQFIRLLLPMLAFNLLIIAF